MDPAHCNTVTKLGRFENSWVDRGEGLSSKIKKGINRKGEGQLKLRLDRTYSALTQQIQNLDKARTGLMSKDSLYYEKIMEALKRDDRDRAIVYANEIAELRRVIKSIYHTRLASEQLSVRVSTVKDIGGIVSTLAPATRILKALRSDVSFILPHADKQFDEISDMLNTTLVEAGQLSGVTVDFSSANAEADKILRNAELQVEGELEKKLPSVPITEAREGVPA
ncbi:MAG: Snf7 family protein [Candidatus Geothermarchaeales archaeon]